MAEIPEQQRVQALEDEAWGSGLETDEVQRAVVMVSLPSFHRGRRQREKATYSGPSVLTMDPQCSPLCQGLGRLAAGSDMARIAVVRSQMHRSGREGASLSGADSVREVGYGADEQI